MRTKLCFERGLTLMILCFALQPACGGGGSAQPNDASAGTSGSASAGTGGSASASSGGEGGAGGAGGAGGMSSGGGGSGGGMITGTAYYFSDCQSGAAATCVPGDNANPGTSPDAPKRDLNGFDVNALQAGDGVLFARGGVWNDFHLVVRNLNATPESPIIFDAYGSGPAPWLKAPSGTAFEFGQFGDMVVDGGYTLRNLKLDGVGTGQWGLWLRTEVRNVTAEDLEITSFDIGIHSQSSSDLTLRNSNVNGNREHGILGGSNGLLIEGNTFANNNPDGGAFEHGIYLSSGNNGVIRQNVFANNSAPNGVCNGGNLTLHGQIDGLLIEGNVIQQAAAAGGCYGLSITTGYDTPEWFRNLTVRGNTIINVGLCAICAGSAPGILVEENKIINTQNTGQTGVLIPTGTPGPGDDADSNAVVRNNLMCFVDPSNVGVNVNVPGAQVNDNTVITGAAATMGACAQ